MSTTAERLHAVADDLDGEVGHSFICSTGERLFGGSWRFHVIEPLLIEGGIESMEGNLIKPYSGSACYYWKEGMNLRFMYLEFLALMLEGEA